MQSGRSGPYRHTRVALLRAAVMALPDAPTAWPDPDDAKECLAWLDTIWSKPEVAEAIEQASPTLAGRVAAMRAGDVRRSKDVRRSALATARYVLRGTGRPTPFGFFAGVAPAVLASTSAVRWGSAHRPVVRADTAWLAEVVDLLEAMPALVERLEVRMTNLATRRGRWLEAPYGPDRIRFAYTAALDETRAATASPIRCGELASKLASSFGTELAAATAMLGELLRRRVLITNLRAPFTTMDPLSHVISQLSRIGVDDLPEASALLDELVAVRDGIREHYVRSETGLVTTAAARGDLAATMRRIAPASRSPLAVDLHLDCDVQVPEQIADDASRAAGVLLRLARVPDGAAGWRAYHRAFVDRYGTGTLVPLVEAVSADAGVGYPPGYPDSHLPEPIEPPSMRDHRLLALAWEAAVRGSQELVLHDDALEDLAGTLRDDALIPPHVEVAVRVHAASKQALDDGDYLLFVSPARAAGVMTSRFTATATGAELRAVYRALPTTDTGALPVQMSFGAAYPYAENITRVPAYLPTVLSLGEHRGPSPEHGVEVIDPDDIAITATANRLHLVSLSRRRIIEPNVFHALDLTKQPPSLARFLARLPRGFVHGWTSFDWGPYGEDLPFLPRVRYGRAVLAPARWRLTAKDLPGRDLGRRWSEALTRWRVRWRCPATVELRDEDRTLRLDLDEPLHQAILQAQLARSGHALLTEAPELDAFGWIYGHAHELAIPLISTRSPAPCPEVRGLPVVTNARSGQMPAAESTRWLYARLHAHPGQHDELIAIQLPALVDELEGADLWFIRYRTPEQADHLRIRVRLTTPAQYGPYATTIGRWAAHLRESGLVAQLLFDTYTPEVGRYGVGSALSAAEAVFVADSQLVIAQLQHLASRVDPLVVTTANMVAILAGFFGTERAMTWLIKHPAAGPAADRHIADAAIELGARAIQEAPTEWPAEVGRAWRSRTAALRAYRQALPAGVDVNNVAESLLHMHHNRARGIDRDGEATCRRLARQAALAWRARRSGAA
ncbi:MAG: lantibiotic dehydratase [Streptosporangiales bacterium]|nr:lantibiotic dehydratase [Streptosporangiales bacterium]